MTSVTLDPIMKTKSPISRLLTAICLLLALNGSAQPYKLNFPKSPDDASGAVLNYIGVWTYTNSFATNSITTNWFNFNSVPAGNTNMLIISTVPSPAYLAVEAQGTNYLLSAPTNIVLYNAAVLATIYTNNPTAPRAPGVPTLSQ